MNMSSGSAFQIDETMMWDMASSLRSSLHAEEVFLMLACAFPQENKLLSAAKTF